MLLINLDMHGMSFKKDAWILCLSCMFSRCPTLSRMLDYLASYYFSVLTFIIYTEKLTTRLPLAISKKKLLRPKTNKYPLKMVGLEDIFSVWNGPSSGQQWKGPWLFRVYRGLYNYTIISHYKGVPIKQPVSCPGANTWCRHSEAKHHEASSEFAGGWNNKSRGSQSSDGESATVVGTMGVWKDLFKTSWSFKGCFDLVDLVDLICMPWDSFLNIFQ